VFFPLFYIFTADNINSYTTNLIPLPSWDITPSEWLIGTFKKLCIQVYVCTKTFLRNKYFLIIIVTNINLILSSRWWILAKRILVKNRQFVTFKTPCILGIQNSEMKIFQSIIQTQALQWPSFHLAKLWVHSIYKRPGLYIYMLMKQWFWYIGMGDTCPGLWSARAKWGYKHSDELLVTKVELMRINKWSWKALILSNLCTTRLLRTRTHIKI
jgi:hypothetical protein